MSEIDIEAVRRGLETWAEYEPTNTAASALSALDQLAKENERLTAENSMLAAGACINPNGNGLLGDDHGNSYCSVERERVALDKQVTDLMARLNEATANVERLTKERDEFLRDATTCGQAAMRHKYERDQAQAYNAQQDLVIDTLRTKLAAMQEAIVEAVRRAGTWYGIAGIIEPLRPHLPTPEPEPVDPLVEEIKALADKHGFELTQSQIDSIAAYFRPAEVRKIGEGAA